MRCATLRSETAARSPEDFSAILSKKIGRWRKNLAANFMEMDQIQVEFSFLETILHTSFFTIK